MIIPNPNPQADQSFTKSQNNLMQANLQLPYQFATHARQMRAI
jgi:hypothetical protein